jgi:hypothetical protein
LRAQPKFLSQSRGRLLKVQRSFLPPVKPEASVRASGGARRRGRSRGSARGLLAPCREPALSPGVAGEVPASRESPCLVREALSPLLASPALFRRDNCAWVRRNEHWPVQVKAGFLVSPPRQAASGNRSGVGKSGSAAELEQTLLDLASGRQWDAEQAGAFSVRSRLSHSVRLCGKVRAGLLLRGSSPRAFGFGEPRFSTFRLSLVRSSPRLRGLG